MGANKLDGRLISFDEAGFTGPHLLDEHQPYFVYASHDLTEDEAIELIGALRKQYHLQGDELKSSRLKKRNDWAKIVANLCNATHGRSKVVVHNKRASLAGKFFEYFFEPVLADNSMLFYGSDFHRYLMTVVYVLMHESSAEYSVIADQMQEFMRKFDPKVAPDIFSASRKYPVEMDRVLRFCRGYAEIIAEKNRHLRPDASDTGKWTLDLTSAALFSLLFFGWGHEYPRLRLLCDDSKPLIAAGHLFNAWVGKDQASSISDGKSLSQIKGNLIAPVDFGSSKKHPTIQVADLLAGMTLDAYMSEPIGKSAMQAWLKQHQLHAHSVDFMPEFTNTGNVRVRIGREILKELADRADNKADPLNGMDEFVRRIIRRFN